jgi:hypothetical protein
MKADKLILVSFLAICGILHYGDSLAGVDYCDLPVHLRGDRPHSVTGEACQSADSREQLPAKIKDKADE